MSYQEAQQQPRIQSPSPDSCQWLVLDNQAENGHGIIQDVEPVGQIYQLPAAFALESDPPSQTVLLRSLKLVKRQAFPRQQIDAAHAPKDDILAALNQGYAA